VSHHLAIMQGAARALTGAFGGGFGIGHFAKKIGTGRVGEPRQLVKGCADKWSRDL
jgi:hypothetical protein